MSKKDYLAPKANSAFDSDAVSDNFHHNTFKCSEYSIMNNRGYSLSVAKIRNEKEGIYIATNNSIK
jgi:hypothetical protein